MELLDSPEIIWWKKFKQSTAYRVGTYFLVRLLLISLTIFAGLYITILIANNSGQFDNALSGQLYNEAADILGINPFHHDDYESELIDRVYQKFAEDAGLFLPPALRNFKYTFDAIFFDLGKSTFGAISWFSNYSDTVSGVILNKLPNTLILIGISYLIVFLIGIPISLFLSRHQGSVIDRFFSLLSPLSSIPAWVLGIIFILVFAVELHLVPFGGMHSSPPPSERLLYYLDIGKHLLLPAFTITVSLMLQFIYIWRTFFLLYSQEDYVELAEAVGIEKSKIDSQYILRPTLPYIITSFTLSLISFWQMIIAIEVVFNWPGLGQIFIASLPNFWGESMYPGDLPTTVGIVVVFAYFLGFIILFMDVVYSLVDPRIRHGNKHSYRRIKFKRENLIERIRNFPAKLTSGIINFFVNVGTSFISFFENIGSFLINLFQQRERSPSSRKSHSKRTLKDIDHRRIGSIISEFRKYPSAIFGFTFITIMIVTSIFLVTSFEYRENAKLWYGEVLTGKSTIPKFGKPIWINSFIKEKYPETEIILSSDENVSVTSEINSDGRNIETLVFTYEFDYGFVPQDINIHFFSQYDEKRPFYIMKWVKPDGTEYEFKGFSSLESSSVKLEELFDLQRLFIQHSQLNDYYSLKTKSAFTKMLISKENSGPVDPLKIAFIDWNQNSNQLQKGTYQLVIESYLFEEDTEINIEMIVIGQVYGWAGTDYLRRDLLVPLLWGMPFALLIGLAGAIITTIGSLFLSAVGSLYGGFINGVIERITEVNLVMPMLVIGILVYTIYFIDIWWILGFIVLLNIFGSPIKSFRAAFLQVVESPYVEAARAYGASNWRIITKYMIPRIMPIVVPQMITVIPSFVFLEATLGLFNIKMNYPTWGRVIYDGLREGSLMGSRYWVLEPIALLLLTGISFIFIGNALDKILNPKLQDK